MHKRDGSARRRTHAHARAQVDAQNVAFCTQRFLQLIGVGSCAPADAHNMRFFGIQRFLQIIRGPLGSFSSAAAQNVWGFGTPRNHRGSLRKFCISRRATRAAFCTQRFLEIIGGPLGSFAPADAQNVCCFCTQRLLQIIGGPLGSFAPVGAQNVLVFCIQCFLQIIGGPLGRLDQPMRKTCVFFCCTPRFLQRGIF